LSSLTRTVHNWIEKYFDEDNGVPRIIGLQDDVTGTISPREKRRRKVTYLILLLLALLLLGNIAPKIPVKQGDGWEYLGMTISFARHGSPELEATDVIERRAIVSQWPNTGWQLPSSLDYAGYYQANNGAWYCYHFWLYSAICAVPYSVLTYLGINPLYVFYITNSVLLLGLVFCLFYRFKSSHKTKIWLFLIVMVSPILFYVSWSHPEVFIFTFFLGGLLDFLNGRYLTGMLMTGIAATQTPTILIVSGAMLIYFLVLMIVKRRKLTWSIRIMLSVSILLMCLPFAFYWIFFGKVSLIADSFADINNISPTKILSLFIDPNFGLIIYTPLLLFSCIFLVFKKKPVAVFGVFLLIGMALISSTQQNWNSGMMYIHRYGIWLLPLLIISSLGFFDRLSQKQLVIFIVLWLSTTGAVTAICLRQSDENNYLEFGPVAKAVIATMPAIYNPPYEVFAERALGQEIPWLDRLPIMVTNNGKMRKELVLNPNTGELSYINGPIQINISSDFGVSLSPSSSDIANLVGGILSWGSGWYPLEQDNQNQVWRWTGPSSKFEFIPTENTGPFEVSIKLRSFSEPRLCTIIVNNVEIFQCVALASLQEFTFSTIFSSGNNYVEIVADSSGMPAETKGFNSKDIRSLSFMFTELDIFPIQ